MGGSDNEIRGWTNLSVPDQFDLGPFLDEMALWTGYKAICKSKPLFQFLWINQCNSVDNLFSYKDPKTFIENPLEVIEVWYTKTKVKCTRVYWRHWFSTVLKGQLWFVINLFLWRLLGYFHSVVFATTMFLLYFSIIFLLCYYVFYQNGN